MVAVAFRPSGSLKAPWQQRSSLRHLAIERLPQRGKRTAAVQIHETGDRSQSHFDVLVIQHRFEFGKIRLPGADAIPSLLYAEHIEQNGIEFFRLACEQNLEGVVAKLSNGTDGERAYKIRNPEYSQYEGMRELFGETSC
jgi:hypothetical protein